jgi:hypothetical protein
MSGYPSLGVNAARSTVNSDLGAERSLACRRVCIRETLCDEVAVSGKTLMASLGRRKLGR